MLYSNGLRETFTICDVAPAPQLGFGRNATRLHLHNASYNL